MALKGHPNTDAVERSADYPEIQLPLGMQVAASQPRRHLSDPAEARGYHVSYVTYQGGTLEFSSSYNNISVQPYLCKIQITLHNFRWFTPDGKRSH